MKKLLALAVTPLMMGATAPPPQYSEAEAVAIITEVLEDLPPAHDDSKYEDDDARHFRLQSLAQSQWEVSHLLTCSGKYASAECVREFEGTSQQMRRLLLTAGWWETRNGWRIHNAKCRKDECDSGKAVSVYQVHDQHFFPKGLWSSAKGATKKATYNATLAAGIVMAKGWKSCRRRHGIHGVWSAYGRGNCTERYPTHGSRVRWYLDSKTLP